ncbi:hypothetical protein EV06_0531 [Prochlorococcus sp. MIT 0602]|nr:hypothetical protein EV06_0531 [Prochlorococcus sp. MIT 0602]KGG18339.1 hypothetical protein EV07_0255 [Prochlorococcus sp. MIT 0603]
MLVSSTRMMHCIGGHLRKERFQTTERLAHIETFHTQVIFKMAN